MQAAAITTRLYQHRPDIINSVLIRRLSLKHVTQVHL
jgi:hypothetical protein